MHSAIMRRQPSVVFLVLAAAAWFDSPAEGHVALTFPPARQYDLDFLDSTRTRAPCGMPKGELEYGYGDIQKILISVVFVRL
jgi:hypothetical protein